MKIAVTGSHRTGKTTLIEKLNEALPEYTCKEEAYYELAANGHVFSEVPGIEDYLLQLEYSITNITTSRDNVIFDRCPIICWPTLTQLMNLKTLIFDRFIKGF